MSQHLSHFSEGGGGGPPAFSAHSNESPQLLSSRFHTVFIYLYFLIVPPQDQRS